MSVQKIMLLCIQCYNLVKDNYDVKLMKTGTKGKCDMCGHPKIFGFEVQVNGKGHTDEQRDYSYPEKDIS